MPTTLPTVHDPAHAAVRAGVVLDVDGTLVDSNYLHVVAWARAFAHLEVYPPMTVIHRLIGRASDDLVEAVLGESNPDVVESQVQAFARLRHEIRPQPGAHALLRVLHDRGLAVVLASSAKSADHAHNIEVLEARDLLAGSVEAADVEHTKPAPDIFQAAMEMGDLDVESTVAIGDSVWDMQAGRAAGLEVIGLTCGGISAEELFMAGASEVYESPADLLDEIEDSVVGQIVVSV
jgi:HAD superfamily hydrolase (TIGR01509 family)